MLGLIDCVHYRLAHFEEGSHKVDIHCEFQREDIPKTILALQGEATLCWLVPCAEWGLNARTAWHVSYFIHFLKFKATLVDLSPQDYEFRMSITCVTQYTIRTFDLTGPSAHDTTTMTQPPPACRRMQDGRGRLPLDPGGDWRASGETRGPRDSTCLSHQLLHIHAENNSLKKKGRHEF